MKVFRTGLLDAADAADIGIPAAPLQRLHADPAAARDRGCAGGKRRARRARSTRSTRRRCSATARTRSCSRVPHGAAAKLAARGRVDASALGARREPDREPARPLRPRASSTSRSRPRSARRCSSSSTARPRPARARASSSRSRSRTRSTRSARRSRRCARALPARRSSGCSRPRAGRRCSTSRSRTSRARRSAPRRARAASVPARSRGVRGLYLAGAWTDTGWPATMEGAVRSGLAAARAALSGLALGAPRRGRRPRDVTRRTTADERRAPSALERGREHLLSLQHPDGCWKGELETNVTIDAEDLFLRHHLGILEPRARPRRPRAGSARSSATTGAWRDVLRRAGRPLDHGRGVRRAAARRRRPATPTHMRRAAALVRELGGVEAHARLHADVALAARALVVERRAGDPAGADPAAAARAALDLRLRLLGAADDRRAPVCCALRPATPAPFAIDELLTGAAPAAPPADAWSRTFELLDRGAPPLRAPADRRRCAAARCAAAERWIVDRQERDGSWGGIQPPWVWSIIALHALGLPARPPGARARVRRASTRFTVEDERRPPARGVPVAGVGHGARRDRAPRRRAAAPSTRRSSARPSGSPAARCSSAATGRCAGRSSPAGGFPFEFANDNYPDVDDTAVVVLALRRAAGDRFTAPVRARARVGARDAEPRRRLGRVRRREHERARERGCRSATSARSPTRRAPT